MSSRPPRGRELRRQNQHVDGEIGETDGELNPALNERFGRGSGKKADQRDGEGQQRPLAPVNQAISSYVNKQIGQGAPKWALRPEVPTVDELLPYTDFSMVGSEWVPVDDAQDAPGRDQSKNITHENLMRMNASWDNASHANHGCAEDDGGVNEWEAALTTLDNNLQETTMPASNGWVEAKGSGDSWEAAIPTLSDYVPQEPVHHTISWDEPAPTAQVDPPSPAKTVVADETHSSVDLQKSSGSTKEDESTKADGSRTEPNASSTLGQDLGASQPGDHGDSSLGHSQYVTADQSLIQDNAPDDAGPANEEEPNITDNESFDNVVNKIEGPWSSKQEYLRNHYLLLREDSLRPLRDALMHVKDALDFNEDPARSNIGIYDQVHVCGITFSGRGLGIRVSFSLGRVGKNIHWAQSKRLMAGSLVILMTPDKASCKVATIAARTLSNLAKNPPEIDLFFSRAEDLDIDCAQEWIMIEERSCFYESGRHTMVALQRMLEEDFPLQEHLVHVQQDVHPPQYVENDPVKDVADVMHLADGASNGKMNILQPWPDDPNTELDASQLTALNTILTKRLALVQGPPGTGKTFVSVQALKILLRNMMPGDPPIIITCQTNHALDQLLLHTAAFEPKFVRLGAQTKDQDIIAKRTLFELRNGQPHVSFRGRKAFTSIIGQMEKLLVPLIKGPEARHHNREVLDLKLLKELGVLSKKQCDLLEKGAAAWITHGETETKDDPLMKWIGQSLEPVKPLHHPTLLEYEEVIEGDVAFEAVVEEDAEGVIQEDSDEIKRLKGDYFLIGDTWTGKGSNNKAARDSAIANLKKDDLWKIKTADRGNVYRQIQREMKKQIALKLRELFARYNLCCQDRKVHNWEIDERLLRDNKVIGMTTTGLSKYRPLVASLKPKVVLIEEAAETLEAPVIAACCESVEHLILVGDHKQLRPNCHVHDLEKEPYYLNISLFERMVNNGIDYSVLRRQRRMKTEIRRLIVPIYGDKIKDHDNVKRTPPIPGMGGLTTWFFHHTMNEERDATSSSYNIFEAQMIFGLVLYLRYNNVPASSITLLTLYQGQRKVLARLMREDDTIGDVKIVTVDSYQGEENDVVILSIVRSNSDGKIGFAGVEHRICVALSRAKRGFYMFGNAELLMCESKLWGDVIRILWTRSGGELKGEKGIKKADTNPWLPQRRRIGFYLPIWCAKHRRMTFMGGKSHNLNATLTLLHTDTEIAVEDWKDNAGGCDLPCNTTLACGHQCPEKCHPWPHEDFSCRRPCPRRLSCGHQCSLVCDDNTCQCSKCEADESTENPEYIDGVMRTFNVAERRPASNTTNAKNGGRDAFRQRLLEDFKPERMNPNRLGGNAIGTGSSSIWHAQGGTEPRRSETHYKHIYRFRDVRKEEEEDTEEQKPQQGYSNEQGSAGEGRMMTTTTAAEVPDMLSFEDYIQDDDEPPDLRDYDGLDGACDERVKGASSLLD